MDKEAADAPTADIVDADAMALVFLMSVLAMLLHYASNISTSMC